MIRKKGRIFFRADGDSQMGLGHIVRCGALAEMISNEWDCVLYTRCTVASVIAESKTRFSTVFSLPLEIEYLEEAKAFSSNLGRNDMVVLDGYHLGEKYQQIIRSAGALLICIDDIHSYFFHAVAVINSAGGITAANYEALPATQFYLGLQYTLLRKPFLERAADRNGKKHNKNILICLGGADPNNTTLEVVQFLVAVNRFDEFRIVTGGGYQHREELEKYITAHQVKAKLLHSLSAGEFAELMSSCSYAVCSPSTVSYEYMTVGGVVYLKQIADNQKDMINYLTAEGFAFHLAEAGATTDHAEQQSLARQASVFDGKAGERLKGIFDKLSLSRQLSTRKVRPADMLRCFEWANDPAVREQSFSSGVIQLQDHNNWFTAKLKDANSFFYIVELENLPVAQIRFQVSESVAVLGYLIDSNYRSKGLGTTILSKGLEAFTNDFGRPVLITGYVKHSNIASQRSFEKLKFTKTEATEYEASYKYTMQYDGN